MADDNTNLELLPQASNFDGEIAGELSNEPAGYAGPQLDFQSVTEAIADYPLSKGIFEIDEDFKSMIARARPAINQFNMGNLTNIKNPFPGRSTQRYNPFTQQNAPDIGTPEGVARYFSNSAEEVGKAVDDPTAGFENPIEVGIRASNFDRFYNHPKFGQLGWHPYSDNEEYYNRSSDMWDDLSRMQTQWMNLAGTGFASVYRSMGDMFDSRRSYIDEDVQSAGEFENAMRIGNSSRGGLTGFFNNFALNSAYTFGIIGSIAAEEVALAAATWASGGILGPAAGVKTAQNVARGLNSIGNLFNVHKYGNATRNLVHTLQNVDKAKDFWTSIRTGGKFVGDIFTPEIMYALRELNSAKSVGNNLSNMAKANILFGGFYRQARALNLAMAEAKMEGGMVYNTMVRDLYQKHKLDTGEAPSDDQLKRMGARARDAAFMDTLTNLPVIYFTNQIVLGTAMRGFGGGLGRLLNETITGVGGRILRDPKKTLKVFYDAGEWGLKRLYKEGIRGGARALGAGALRYSSANFAEGFQEIAQEAIAVGTSDYYTGLYNDPSMGGIDLQRAVNASTKKAIESQMGWEGFEVFMSGFLMGGLVQPVQTSVFKGLPYLYNITANRKAYKEYQDKKTKYINNAVETLNEGFDAFLKNPRKYFDPSTLNAIAVKQLSQDMLDASFQSDALYFYDSKDAMVFNHLYTAMQTGKMFEFKSQIEDFMKMDDKDLAGAFPDQKEDVESGKMKERLGTMISRAEEMEKDYKELDDKFINPYDSSKFKMGSREHDVEFTKELAFNHAKMLALFTRKTFTRAVERANSIYEEFATDPIISKMAANEIGLFLSAKNLKTEIETLTRDIETMTDPLTEEQKTILARKKRRLSLYNNYLDVLSDPENWQKDKGDRLIYEGEIKRIDELKEGESPLRVDKVIGVFDRRKINKLRKPFVAILKDIANEQEDFYDPKMITSALKKIVDYKFLKNRGHDYFKAMDTLLEPGRMDILIDRMAEVNLKIWDNRKAAVKERIAKYINLGEKNFLLNQLAKLGVYPTPEDAELFMTTDKIPTDFIDQQGPVTQTTDANKYKLIQDEIKSYNKSQGKEAAEEKKKKKKDLTKEEQDFEDIITGATSEGKQFSAGTQLVLKLNFEKALKRDESLQPSKWITSKKAKDIIKTRALLENNYDAAVTDTEKQNLPFEAWLTANKDDTGVYALINKFGLKYSDVSIEALTSSASFSQEAFNANERILDKTDRGGGFVYKEIKTSDQEGVDTIYYSIVTGDNEVITNAVYRTFVTQEVYFGPEALKQSQADWNTLKANLPESDIFMFDGLRFQRGQVVKNKEGKKFKVYSTAKWVESSNKLNLIAVEQWTDKTPVKWQNIPDGEKVQLKSGQWVAEGWQFDIDSFTKMPGENKKSKLRMEEPVLFIPHTHGKFDSTMDEESLEDTNARFQVFMRNLTPEELNDLELIVTPGEFFVPGADVFAQKTSKSKGYEENPQVRIGHVKYKITVRIKPGSATASKYAELIKEQDEELQTSDIIGYVQGPHMASFISKDGTQVIHPLKIDATNVGEFFVTWPRKYTNTQAAEIVRESYAKAYAFEEMLEKKLEEAGGDSVTLRLGDLDDVSFNVSEGSIVYGEPISFADELKHKYIRTIDGRNIIWIMDITKYYGLAEEHAAESIISNINPFTDKALFSEIWTEVKDDIKLHENSFNPQANLGKYVAVVKLPNGTITYIPLKTAKLNDTQTDQFAVDLINRQDLTIEHNIEITGTYPNQSRELIQTGSTKTKVGELDLDSKHGYTFNSKWNEIQQGEYYITGFPGMLMTLTVTPLGDIKLDVSDKNRTALKDDIKQGFNYWERSYTIGKNFRIDNSGGEEKQGEFDIDALINVINGKIALEESQDKVPKGQDPNAQKVGEYIKKKFRPWKLTRDAFRKSLPKDPQEKEFSDPSIQTDVNNPIRGAIKITVNVVGTKYNKWINATIPTPSVTPPVTSETGTVNLGNFTSTIPEGGKAPAAEVKTTGKDELTADQRSDAIMNDFEGYDLMPIAKKVANQEPLDKWEQTVLDSKTSEINLLAAGIQEKQEEEKQETETENEKLFNRITGEKTKLAVRKDDIRKEVNDILPEGSTENSIAYIERTSKDKQIKDIKAEIARLEALLEAGTALKVTDSFDARDVEDINVFIDWASRNLPDFINIRDIEAVRDRLTSNGMTVGAFVLQLKNISGGLPQVDSTIYTGANTPYRYHEAFHAVFRMLLSNEEHQHYLALAEKEVKAKLKKGKISLQDELLKLRNSAVIYMHMTDKQLEKTYYEEYLADEFEKYKTGQKTSKGIRNLFQKIIDWILEVFRIFTPNELTQLFKNIDSGKYKTSRMRDNTFTQDVIIRGVTTTALKQIKLKTIPITVVDKITKKTETRQVNVYETADRQREMVNTIGQLYIEAETKAVAVAKANDEDTVDQATLLRQVVFEYIAMFNKRRKFYTNWKDTEGNLINSMIPFHEIEDELDMYFEAYTENEKEIREEVSRYLQLFNVQGQQELYDREVLLDEGGTRNVGDWDQDSTMIGGYSSLPREIRLFLATVTMAKTDKFGNSALLSESERKKELVWDKNKKEFVVEMEPTQNLVIGTDYITVYNGMLKATKDTKDPVKIVQKMWFFAKGNVQTRAVVKALFDTMGITVKQVENNTLPKKIKNANFFNTIVKGFGQFRVDNLFVQTDPKTGLTHVYAANNKDDASSQITSWSKHYNRELWHRLQANKTERDKVVEWLQFSKNYFVPEEGIVPDALAEITTYDELQVVSQELATEMFEKLGISLSPSFIAFSIARNLTNATGALAGLVNAHEGDVAPMTYEDLEQISQAVDKGHNLFLDIGGMGVKSRLKRWANGNGKLDETVGASTFKDPEGNMIYAHQMPSYHLEEVIRMNELGYIKEKLNEPYLKNNMLLNSPEFAELLSTGGMRVVRINGNKVAPVRMDEESGDLQDDLSMEIFRQPGITYGKGTATDFLTNIVNASIANYNYFNQKTITYETNPGEKDNIQFTTSPVLIRVIAAGNIGDMAALPVKHTVEKNEDGDTQLKEESIDVVMDNIKNEFTTIKTEVNELSGYHEDEYQGWNDWVDKEQIADKDAGTFRAAEFTQTGDFLVRRELPEAFERDEEAPKMPRAVQIRIVAGTQRIFLRPGDTAARIKLRKGQSRMITLAVDPSAKKKEYKTFMILARGVRNWNDLSDEAKTEFIALMGGSVGPKSTTLKYKVKGMDLYTERLLDARFLGGVTPQHMYEFIPVTEETEGFEIGIVEGKETASIKANYALMSIEQLEKLAKQAVEEEKYESAKVIKEYIDEKRKPTTAKGENINSKGSSFAKKLTNPGNALKVEYKGKTFRNSEHAYQTWKSGEFDQKAFESTAFKPVGSKLADRNTSYQTMVDIITAKLEQHPDLIEGINKRGGIEYLNKSTHEGFGDKFWEGSEGGFMRALKEAYTNITGISEETLTAKVEIIITPEHLQEIGYEYEIKTLENIKSYDFVRAIKDIRNAEQAGLFTNVLEGKVWIRENLLNLTKESKPVLFKQDTSIKEGLEKAAQENKSWKDALMSVGQTEESLRDLVKERMMIELEEFLQLIDDINANKKISKAIKNGLTNDKGKPTPASDKANELFNFKRNDPHYNLSQIFFNDLLNTFALNDLLLGNQAMSLKSAIDAIKRAKMQAAAGYSAATVYGDDSFGIEHAVQDISAITIEDQEFLHKFGVSTKEGVKKDKGERNDGQVYGTVKAFMYLWYGLGKLNAAQSDMLHRIHRGEAIPFREVEKLGLEGRLMNAKKFVYADGQVYVKMSWIMLSKEWTSYLDNQGVWQAKPNMVELHNLRVKLEAVENKKGAKTLGIAVSKSASKMMKRNIIKDAVGWSSTPIEEKDITHLDANNWRLQQINPTNKKEIKSPTQIKAVITSEHNDNEEILLYGVPTKLGKIKELYNTAHSNKVKLEYFGRRDLIFDFPNAMDALHQSIDLQEITVELRSFLLFAEASLGAAQARTQMLELFSMDETGNQKFPLIGPQTAQKFTELFMTYFGNKTLNEKSPGHSYSTLSGKGANIIRKVYTLDKEGRPDRSEIMRIDEWVALAETARPKLVKEKFDNPDPLVLEFSGLDIELEKAKKNGDDHIYIIDRLRHNLKWYDENGEWKGDRYSEMVAPPHFKEVVDKIIISRKYRSIDEIHGEFVEYISNSNWSKTAQADIIRIDIENFDLNRAKAEFANAKGYFYNKYEDEFEEYGNKKWKGIPDVIAKQFSVRIPSQDKHSAINIRLVDFMPAFYGSTAMFPDELIEQTGWDFDIDQVYTQIKEFYTVHDDFFEYGAGKTEEDKYADYIRYTVAESNKSGSTLNEAIEQFNQMNPLDERGRDIGQEGIIDQFFDKRELEKRIGARPLEGAPQEVKDKYTEVYKELFIQSLLSFVQKETRPLLKLWDKQVKEKNRGSIMGAMELLHLPITFDDYQAYKAKNKREPYVGAINNKIIDYKYALLSSKGMTEPQHGRDVPVAHEPAVVDPLADLWAILKNPQTGAPEYAKTVSEQGYFRDSMLGKTKAWMANKADVSIGAVVLPNVVMNLLGQENVEILSKVIAGEEMIPQIVLNGVHYNKFNVTHEIDSDPTSSTYKQQMKADGLRTHFVISALITAATDNPTERYMAKLGLNKDALALVTNLVALGVSLKTATLLVLHPTIRHNYFLALNKDNPFDWGIGALLRAQKKDILKAFKEQLGKEEFDYTVGVSDELLMNKLQRGKTSRFTVKSKLSGEYKVEDAIEEIAVIDQFLAAHNIKTFTGNIQSIITLNNGFGRDTQAIDDRELSIERLGLELTDKEFELHRDPISKLPLPMDIRPVFKDDKTWQGVYYDVWREFVYQLLPSVFLTRTPDFLHLKKTMLQNLTKDGRYMSAAQMNRIEKDLTSYLIIKAYKHSLEGSPFKASLQNGFIYDQAQGLLTINEVMKGVEKHLSVSGPIDPQTKKSTRKPNFFIDEWAVVNPTTDLDNYTGTNQLNNNTWSGADDSAMQYVQNSFAELYSDPMTREAAYHIVHYLMVKAGLQYKGHTIMDAIPPFILDRFLGQATHVHNVFKMQKTTDPAMRSVFGVTMNELKNEFLENYARSIGISWLLTTMQRLKYASLIYNPPQVSVTVKATGDYSRNLIAEENDKLYVFGEHIEKMGTDSIEPGGIQDQRSLRGLANAIGIPVKINSNNEKDGYFNDEDLQVKKDLITGIVEEIKAEAELGKEIIFPRYLVSAKQAQAMKAYAPDLYDHLSKLLFNQFGYRLYAGGKTATAKSSAKAIKNPIYIDETQADSVMIIDQLSGIASADRLSGRTRKVHRAGSKAALAQNKSLRVNDDFIAKMGIKERRTVYYDHLGQAVEEVGFPMQVKLNMTTWQQSQEGKKAKYRYFYLNKLYMYRNEAVGEDLVKMLQDNEYMAYGNKAEYIEYDPMGSRQQWPGGFMFDTTDYSRPTYRDVRATVKAQHDKMAGMVLGDHGHVDPMAAINKAESGKPTTTQSMYQDQAAAAKKIEVTNDSIKLDGQNVVPAPETENIKQQPTEAEPVVAPEGLAVDINTFKNMLNQSTSSYTYQKIVDWYDTLTPEDIAQLEKSEQEGGLGKVGKLNTINKYKETVLQLPDQSQEEWIEEVNKCILGK